MNDSSHYNKAMHQNEAEIPRLDPFPEQSYQTAHEEQITIYQDNFGRYIVNNYDKYDECRWHLEFDKQSDAVKEFERWR